MSGPAGSSTWFGKDPVYEIGQSLRFNDGDSAYLTFTAGTPTSAKIGTFSVWVKACGLTGADQSLFGSYTNANNRAYIRLHTDGNINMYDPHSSSGSINIKTTATYRDPSAWMHILIAIDVTQGTSSNRLKIYVNGEQVTDFSAETYPDNVDQTLFKDGNTYAIGASQDSAFGRYLDGYLAEYNFIDGQQLTPASFGETGTYGEWKPKKYGGAYGNNGFYLTGADGVVMSATGGNSTATDGDFKAASFTSNGTFTPSADGYVEYLVIAGGGAGAADGATTAGNGGGGAGGYRTGMLAVTADTGYSITVGAGGVGALSASAVNGGNSVFSSITSTGGGGGGYFTSTPGAAGGSGGGGSAQTAAGGAASPAGQGNAGETATNGQGGGGGGGAGEAGGTDGVGQGGDGLASSITGSSVTRAGGGGGSFQGATRVGGAGGGGAGGNSSAGGDGSANTGSGGGAGIDGNESGSGGSGIVIIRYKFQ
jgi:hypothetical protein